jgi:glucokinase
MTIGVDLGGTNVRAGVESEGRIYQQRGEIFNNRGSLEDTLEQLVEFIRPLVSPAVTGIGIGVPSVVDIANGIVYNVGNIPAWKAVPLRQILKDALSLPVAVNNDVNCFILGEHRFGEVKGKHTVVGISSGTGLGAGIVIDDQLYNGRNCGAGELGLLAYLDRNIEYYASGNFFEAVYQLPAIEAHRRALAGDATAIALWQEFGAHIGHAIKTVVLTYDPEAIVIGGSLSKAFRFFEEAMYTSLENFCYPESIRRLEIYQSRNENIALLGAAALISRHQPAPSVR